MQGTPCCQSSEEKFHAAVSGTRQNVKDRGQLTVIRTTKLPETTYRPQGASKTKENRSLRNSTERGRNEGMKRWHG